MVIRNRNGNDIRPSEITPRGIYLNRRELMGKAAGLGASAGLAGSAALSLASLPFSEAQAATLAFEKSKFSTSEPVTAREYVTSYNNYYEFGVDKGDPGQQRPYADHDALDCEDRRARRQARRLRARGFLKPFALEERIYRHRCVEGWSMVIPWVGFPLAKVLERAEPLGAPNSSRSRR